MPPASIHPPPIAPAAGPLRVHAANPRYLSDGANIVYLTGIHDGWEVQDNAYEHSTPVIFDFDAFLDDTVAHGLNLMRFWTVEHAKSGAGACCLTDPMPYRRVPGHGTARDGRDKFDLDQFEPRFFERLRQRASAAGARGVYCLVMLFCGLSDWGARRGNWGQAIDNSSFHPFRGGNNCQGLDADLNGDGRVTEVHTWQGEDHWLTRRQRAYVRQVIDALNDLDNVLWEICNECPFAYSQEWQFRMVEWIHACEAAHKPKQHSVLLSGGGMIPGAPNNPALFAGPAECVAPDHNGEAALYATDIPPADGRKVVLLDTDHIRGYHLTDHRWVWKAFTAGCNPVYMDQWTFQRDDPARIAIRRSLGHARRLALRLDLAQTLPHPELASTGYCLAAPGHEYVVYQPQSGAPFTVHLEPGAYRAEWLDPVAGQPLGPSEALAVSSAHAFSAPASTDAVLHLQRVPA